MTVEFVIIGFILVMGFTFMVGGFIALGLLINKGFKGVIQHVQSMERAAHGMTDNVDYSQTSKGE